MKGSHKGLSARLMECSPLAIYVHCYGHLLNLAVQDTMSNIKLLRNTLGTIQSLHNFLEGSPKRYAIFNAVEVDTGYLARSLKSLSVTRWSCRWEAVKSVNELLDRIVKALLLLSKSDEPNTSTESSSVLKSVCTFEFVLGVCILKLILSNTNSLSKYLQGKQMDVCTARRNAKLTIQTLHQCRSEENFRQVWLLTERLEAVIKTVIDDTEVSFVETKLSRQRQPSR